MPADSKDRAFNMNLDVQQEAAKIAAREQEELVAANQKRIDDKNTAHSLFVTSSVTGSLTWGAVGLAIHAAAQKFHPFYRNKFGYQGKVLMVTAFAVAGWAINGENTIQDFHREERRRRERVKRAKIEADLAAYKATRAAANADAAPVLSASNPGPGAVKATSPSARETSLRELVMPVWVDVASTSTTTEVTADDLSAPSEWA